MTYYRPIQDIDPERVEEIKTSILANGYTGCPILVCGPDIISGTHRQQAIHDLVDAGLCEDDEDLYYEDVTDLIEVAYTRETGDDDYSSDYFYNYYANFAHDQLGRYFEGTWVEQYKDCLVEW